MPIARGESVGGAALVALSPVPRGELSGDVMDEDSREERTLQAAPSTLSLYFAAGSFSGGTDRSMPNQPSHSTTVLALPPPVDDDNSERKDHRDILAATLAAQRNSAGWCVKDVHDTSNCLQICITTSLSNVQMNRNVLHSRCSCGECLCLSPILHTHTHTQTHTQTHIHTHTHTRTHLLTHLCTDHSCVEFRPIYAFCVKLLILSTFVHRRACPAGGLALPPNRHARPTELGILEAGKSGSGGCLRPRQHLCLTCTRCLLGK